MSSTHFFSNKLDRSRRLTQVQSIGYQARAQATADLPGGTTIVGGTPMTEVARPALIAETTTNPRGSELRFEAVFAEFAPYVLRVMPRLGVGTADVDDVAQEVFIAVHKGLAEFEGRSRVRTWIYGICLRVAGNYRRRAHRRREVRGLDIEETVGPAQGEALERQRSRQLLMSALEGLSERKREVFVLYEIEELSMAEVAQAVDCPLFTAYARLYAARREMKQAIERATQSTSQPTTRKAGRP